MMRWPFGREECIALQRKGTWHEGSSWAFTRTNCPLIEFSLPCGRGWEDPRAHLLGVHEYQRERKETQLPHSLATWRASASCSLDSGWVPSGKSSSSRRRLGRAALHFRRGWATASKSVGFCVACHPLHRAVSQSPCMPSCLFISLVSHGRNVPKKASSTVRNVPVAILGQCLMMTP
jgi:hypothetical protein